MRALIANVHAADQWWGPDYGNANDVPDEIAEEITNPDVWLDIPDPVTEQGPDVPSLTDWLAASTGEEVVAFVDEWVEVSERDRVVLEFIAAEHAGEGRQDVLDTLTAALPPEPMTPEELAEVARREAAGEAAGDTGSTPPNPPDVSMTGDLDALSEWVHNSSIDQIEERVSWVEDAGERAELVGYIIETDAGGKARKGLVERLGQYATD